MTPPHVYLDSNVFIAAFEHRTAHSDHAWWIFQAIQRGEIHAATSEITLAELLVRPLQLGATELASAYQNMIVEGPHFELQSIDRSILIQAAAIRAGRSSIKLPDAIHIATARALSCRFFISEDYRLALPEDLKLIPINPFTLDDILREQA